MDKAKKKRIKKYISWISMAVVVALLAAMPLIARQEAEADGPVASVLSAEAVRGSISSSLHGGGTIAAETVEEVKLPDGVKIKEFLVKNGQFVTEGTPVATVDKVSVMTAITEVTETMEYLREELESARDEKVSSAVKATAGGRVKKIFAQKGDSVQEVMLRDGCLAVLSLDSLMAVKLEEKLDLTTGESVTVELSGKEVPGRVESNLDGVVIITVEDEDYEIGTPVTVTSHGEVLGNGELYVHNAWKATAYTGTIETVNAKEEKTLSSGATLFTLTDRDYEGELRHRASQHREYEALLQELFRMYESGILTAPCDGEIEGVDEDSAYLLSAVPDGWVIAPLNNTASENGEKPYRVLLLSSDEIILGPPEQQGGGESLCTNNRSCQWQEANPAKHGQLCIRRCDKSAGCGAKTHYGTCLSQCTGERTCTNGAHKADCKSVCTGKAGCEALPDKHKTGCPEKCTNNGLCRSSRPKEEHEAACIIHCVRDVDAKDLSIRCDAKNHYLECIERCTGNKECQAVNHKTDCYYYGVTYTACVGIVKEVSSGTIKYKYAAEFSNVTAVRDAVGNFTITVKPDFNIMNKEGFVSSSTACNPGDVILIVTGTNANGVEVVTDQVHVYQVGGFDMSGLAGMMGGFGGLGGFDLSQIIGGFAGFGNYGAAAPEEEPLFDLEGNTLLTVIPHDGAKLIISIDEHDIAKVQAGMQATVRVEALKGREFAAEVTNVGLAGSNNGGSSKFRVELSLPMSEDMLAGMSASAILPLEEKTDVLLIPAAALVQQGARSVVFTALDEKTGEPAAPVEVQTGLTDGENVEILSGLSEGQKVYYSYYDTVELDTSAEADKYTLR